MFQKVMLFAGIAGVISVACAETIIPGGNVSGTWAAAGSPYLIMGEITVPGGRTLNIQPGVQVIFQGHYKLVVNGLLEAVGTQQDSIRFTAADTAAGWWGIRFVNAPGTSHLSYCRLEHGHAVGSYPSLDRNGGAVCCYNSNPAIAHCAFYSNSASADAEAYGGAIYCEACQPAISQCDFISNQVLGPMSCGAGIACYAASPSIDGCNFVDGYAQYSSAGIAIGYGGASPIINNCTFSGGRADVYDGAIGSAYSNPTITNCVMSGNTGVMGAGAMGFWGCSGTVSNCIITGNTAYEGGGIGFIAGSTTMVLNCTISNNTATGYGGGLGVNAGTAPVIQGCTIEFNTAATYGGGIACESGSGASIQNCTISGNSASTSGGGINCDYANPTISGNTIRGNLAPSGGGIYCSNSSPSIVDNLILFNQTNSGYGGGIYCYYSNASISGNTIISNTAVYGGGIRCWVSSPVLIGNTIAGNWATYGGGVNSGGGNPTLVNCILWGNTPDQLTDGPEATYCDIQGGYPGTGNINADPNFVNISQNDYRLQWGSPCIDSGDPSPTYNDPDGTRADMGAWYYDQSVPVRILLTPYSAPIQIPASGGSFNYGIQATNIETTTLVALVWCNVTLPNGNPYGPVLGPLTISLASGQTLSRVRTQAVPAGAPAGMYHYNAYAVSAGDTSSDNFIFTKLGSNHDWLGADGWISSGESFPGETSASAEGAQPNTPTLKGCNPNPFNPSTALGYQLSADGHVSLRVYDTVGRLVAILVNDWREAGEHQITFDGSGLPSGIYFARLEAGEFSAAEKLVLLK